MFKVKKHRIRALAEKYPHRIEELEKLLDQRTNGYIDFANVKPWATNLS